MLVCGTCVYFNYAVFPSLYSLISGMLSHITFVPSQLESVIIIIVLVMYNNIHYCFILKI